MDETTQAVLERVDALAAKLGDTAEALVAEQAAIGWVYVCGGLLLTAIVWGVCVYCARAQIRLDRDGVRNEGGHLVISLVTGLAGAIFMVLLVGRGALKVMAPMTSLLESI